MFTSVAHLPAHLCILRYQRERYASYVANTTNDTHLQHPTHKPPKCPVLLPTTPHAHERVPPMAKRLPVCCCHLLPIPRPTLVTPVTPDTPDLTLETHRVRMAAHTPVPRPTLVTPVTPDTPDLTLETHRVRMAAHTPVPRPTLVIPYTPDLPAAHLVDEPITAQGRVYRVYQQLGNRLLRNGYDAYRLFAFAIGIRTQHYRIAK